MMNDFGDRGAPQNEQDAAARKKSPKAKIPPPRTLIEYYQGPKPRAASFLSELRKMHVEALSLQDEEQVLPRLEALDPNFKKTHELMYRAILGTKSSAAAACLAWVGKALLARLRDRYGWAPREDDTGLDCFKDLLAILSGGLRDKRRRAAALNELLVAMSWAFEKYGLDVTVAVRALRQKLFDKPGPRKDRDAHSWNALACIVRPPVRQKQLGDLVGCLELWDSRMLEARAETLTMREKSDELRKRIEALTLKMEERETDLKELAARLAVADQKLAEMNESFRQSENLHSHSIAELRAQVQGFLNAQLRSFLGTAGEALTLSPPRLTVVRERLEMALSAIDEELKWLKSSG